ncbi:MAG: hypothetical protein WAL08_18935, partial [Candidatus Sulfotelmatobacter sp.]
GQTPLPSSVFPTDQFPQLIAQPIITKYVGQSNDRLLYCANPLHNVGALPYELSQIFFCSFHDFLNVRVAARHKLLCARAHCRFGV